MNFVQFLLAVFLFTDAHTYNTPLWAKSLDKTHDCDDSKNVKDMNWISVEFALLYLKKQVEEVMESG